MILRFPASNSWCWLGAHHITYLTRTVGLRGRDICPSPLDYFSISLCPHSRWKLSRYVLVPRPEKRAVFAASLVNSSFSGTGTYWVGFVLSAQCQRIRCRPHQMLHCPEVAVTYYYDNQLFTMPYLLINWSKSCIANLPLSWHYDPHGWRVLRSLSGKSWANG